MQWLIDIILEQFKGMIVMWSGLLADIPEGWALCDGTNGTPDLLYRFVLGATSDVTIGSTGGTDIHNHDFTSNTHRHDIPTDLLDVVTDTGAEICGTKQGDVVSSLETVTGTTDNTSHMPPWYRLAFIMKL